MAPHYRRLIAAVAAAALGACVRPANVPAPSDEQTRFSEMLAAAQEHERQDGLGAAMPYYLAAIAVDPAAERAQIIRYQLALNWLERGDVPAALDMLAAILDAHPNHPLAGPLYRDLAGPRAVTADTGSDAATTATIAATAAAGVSAATAPAAVTSGHWLARLAQHDEVRILVTDPKALAWRVYFPNGAAAPGGSALPAGTAATLGALTQRPWRALQSVGGGPVPMHVGEWQGHARLTRSSDGRVVLHLPLEEYLVGVVATEMSPAWHIQALRAQAIASRTYVVHALLKVPAGRAYDVRGDVLDQAFTPAASGGSSAQAVVDTRGELLTWGDAPANAFFSADNGGMSEDPKFVWGFDLPYYRIRKDPFSDQVPAWEARLPVAQVARALKLAAPSKVTLQRGPSGRVVRVLWTAGARTTPVRGNDFRLAVGSRVVRSLLFDVTMADGAFTFRGRGYGHGVGMSQWGAKTMAERGVKYPDILAYYYPGTRLARMDANAQTMAGLP